MSRVDYHIKRSTYLLIEISGNQQNPNRQHHRAHDGEQRGQRDRSPRHSSRMQTRIDKLLVLESIVPPRIRLLQSIVLAPRHRVAARRIVCP